MLFQCCFFQCCSIHSLRLRRTGEIPVVHHCIDVTLVHPSISGLYRYEENTTMVEFCKTQYEYTKLELLKIMKVTCLTRTFSLHAWLQLVPVTVTRDSKISLPSIHITLHNPPPSKPVQLHHQPWLGLLFFNNFH